METGAVLLVDDEPAYGAIVKALMLSSGLEVDHVADALEALQAVRSRQFSLILMDIEMAGITGLRGTAILRQSADWARRVPIIAFTSFRPPTGERHFLERNFDGWLPKPFTARDFFDVLGRWVGGPWLERNRPARATQLDALLGPDRALELMQRLRISLAEAIAAIDSGADPKPFGHRLGGLMGTVGLSALSAAWLTLSDCDEDIWPTVRSLSVDWLAR
jgi:two-component system OmpR family response regulator